MSWIRILLMLGVVSFLIISMKFIIKDNQEFRILPIWNGLSFVFSVFLNKSNNKHNMFFLRCFFNNMFLSFTLFWGMVLGSCFTNCTHVSYISPPRKKPIQKSCLLNTKNCVWEPKKTVSWYHLTLWEQQNHPKTCF